MSSAQMFFDVKYVAVKCVDVKYVAVRRYVKCVDVKGVHVMCVDVQV